MIKSKLRTKGEIIAYIVLLIVSLWFFLINFIVLEETISYELTTQAIVSGVIFLLSVIWGIVNLIRFKKFSNN
jgi:hypothetical protein